MISRTLVCIAFAAASVAQAADVPDPSMNRTLWREQENSIPSVFYDIRTQAGPTAEPGSVLPWPRGSFRFSINQSEEVWSASSVLNNPPGLPIQALRNPLKIEQVEYEFTYRQSLWTPWPEYDLQFEVSGGYTDRDRTVPEQTLTIPGLVQYTSFGIIGPTLPADTDPQLVQALNFNPIANQFGSLFNQTLPEGSAQTFHDLYFGLHAPIFNERYLGVTVGAGITVPMDDNDDWVHTHDTLGYHLDLRGSLLVYHWTTISVQGRVSYAPGPENLVYTSTGLTTNPLLAPLGVFAPREEVNVGLDYLAIEGTITAQSRITQWFGYGLSQTYEQHRFDDIVIPGQFQSPSETMVKAPSTAFITLTYPARLWWTVSVSKDFITNTDVDQSLLFGLSMEVVPW